MPLYEYQCDACGHRFEVIQKFSDPPIETCPKCGGPGPQAAVVARDSVQGHRLVHHRLREEGSRRERRRRRGDETATKDAADERRRPTRPRRPRSRQDRQAEKSTRRRRAVRRATADVARRARIDARARRATRRRTRAECASLPLRRPASAGRATSGRPRTCSARSGRRSAKYTTAFRNPSLLPVSWRTPFDLARVDRPRLQQLAQAVGQLDLAGAVALGRRQRREDVGRQDVAADDRQVRRRLFARRLLDEIAHLIDAVAERRASARRR